MDERDIREVEAEAGDAEWQAVRAFRELRVRIIAFHRGTRPGEPLPSVDACRALLAGVEDALDAYETAVDATLAAPARAA